MQSALATFSRIGLSLCVGMLALATSATAQAVRAHEISDEDAEVARLIEAGSPDSLAVASLLARLIPVADEDSNGSGPARPEPSELIQRAVVLAPGRPELVWLQLRVCQQQRCGEEPQIADRLKALDPDNGVAWLGDARAAQGHADVAMTQAIVHIGAARHPQLYWNKLAVMMYDALTHLDQSRPGTALTQHADDRLTHVIGILAAVDSPVFQPLTYACRLDHLDLQGRRTACESAMARLESSDAAIAENVSLSMQESWWPVGSPQYAAVHGRLLQQRYLAVASGRVRGSRADADAQLRIDAMRRLPREEDVARAVLRAFHEPSQRPVAWASPDG